MELRLARRDDSSGIATVHVQSWQAAYAGLFTPSYLASLSIAEREQSWAGILEVSASSTVVATANDTVIGFICFARSRDRDAPADRGEVWALYVSPSGWSTGVGRALWEA